MVNCSSPLPVLVAMLRLCQSEFLMMNLPRLNVLECSRFENQELNVIKIRNVIGDVADFNFQNVFIHIVINV